MFESTKAYQRLRGQRSAEGAGVLRGHSACGHPRRRPPHAAPRRRSRHARLPEARLRAGHLHDPQLSGRRHRSSRRRLGAARRAPRRWHRPGRERHLAPKAARSSPGSPIPPATSCPSSRRAEHSKSCSMSVSLDGVRRAERRGRSLHSVDSPRRRARRRPCDGRRRRHDGRGAHRHTGFRAERPTTHWEPTTARLCPSRVSSVSDLLVVPPRIARVGRPGHRSQGPTRLVGGRAQRRSSLCRAAVSTPVRSGTPDSP